MLLFLIGFLFIVSGLIGWLVYECDEGGPFIMGIGVFWIICILLIIPVALQDNNANIESFKSIQATLSEARLNSNISEFELATIQKEVINSNQWLARQKVFANLPIFGMYYHTKKINNLEAIK